MFFMRQMQGGGGRGALSFGKSRARMIEEDQVKGTFADVAGVDEAKEDYTKYSKLREQRYAYKTKNNRLSNRTRCLLRIRLL